MLDQLTQLTYLVSTALFIFSLQWMSDPKTARRYIRAGQGPQELKPVHTWRTRADPVAVMWPVAQRWLEETPELEAKMLFEHLLADPALAGQVDGRADHDRRTGRPVPGSAVRTRREHEQCDHGTRERYDSSEPHSPSL